MPFKWYSHRFLSIAYFFIGFLFYSSSVTHPVLALRINEVYSSPKSGNFEWVEIFNETLESVDTGNYFLLDLAGNKITIASQILDTHQIAIASSSAVLNNSGDTLFLKSADTTIQSISIPALDSSQSFAACPDGSDDFSITSPSFSSSNDINCQKSPTPSPTPAIIGENTTTPSSTISPSPTTLDEQNIINPNPTPTPTSTPLPIESPTQTLTPSPTPSDLDWQDFDSNKIFISEYSPFSSDTIDEWVEIYNDNDTDAYLLGWAIDDIEGGASAIDLDFSIPPKSIVVVELKNSIFNNSGDTIRLLDTDNIVQDFSQYNQAQEKTSFGRYPLSKVLGFCEMNPSKSISNSNCIFPSSPNPTPTNSTSTISSLPTPTIIAETPSYKVLSSSTIPDSSFDGQNSQYIQTPFESVLLEGAENKPSNIPKPLPFFISSFVSFLGVIATIIKKHFPENVKFW